MNNTKTVNKAKIFLCGCLNNGLARLIEAFFMLYPFINPHDTK